MSTPHPALPLLGGAIIAFGLAGFVALSPQPTPRLIATPIESHDHGPYHPPFNTEYRTSVAVCVDRPGRVRIEYADVAEGAPVLREFGAESNDVVEVAAQCPDSSHGEDTHSVPSTLRLVLAGESPKGAGATTVRLRYTVEGQEGEHETSVALPSVRHRPT